MRKASLIISIALVLGFIIGFFVFSKGSKNKEDGQLRSGLYDEIDKNEQYTNSNMVKTTPNTVIIRKVYFTDCNHILVKQEAISDDMVNLTEEEFREKNTDWDIKEFDVKEIVMYKQENGYCKEHYILKDDNGYIAIYEMNNKDKISRLYEKTNIQIRYLTEEDRKNLEYGIRIYTKEKLNKILEDFE